MLSPQIQPKIHSKKSTYKGPCSKLIAYIESLSKDGQININQSDLDIYKNNDLNKTLTVQDKLDNLLKLIKLAEPSQQIHYQKEKHSSLSANNNEMENTSSYLSRIEKFSEILKPLFSLINIPTNDSLYINFGRLKIISSEITDQIDNNNRILLYGIINRCSKNPSHSSEKVQSLLLEEIITHYSSEKHRAQLDRIIKKHFNDKLLLVSELSAYYRKENSDNITMDAYKNFKELMAHAQDCALKIILEPLLTKTKKALALANSKNHDWFKIHLSTSDGLSRAQKDFTSQLKHSAKLLEQLSEDLSLTPNNLEKIYRAIESAVKVLQQKLIIEESNSGLNKKIANKINLSPMIKLLNTLTTTQNKILEFYPLPATPLQTTPMVANTATTISSKASKIPPTKPSILSLAHGVSKPMSRKAMTVSESQSQSIAEELELSKEDSELSSQEVDTHSGSASISDADRPPKHVRLNRSGSVPNIRKSGRSQNNNHNEVKTEQTNKNSLDSITLDYHYAEKINLINNFFVDVEMDVDQDWFTIRFNETTGKFNEAYVQIYSCFTKNTALISLFEQMSALLTFETKEKVKVYNDQIKEKHGKIDVSTLREITFALHSFYDVIDATYSAVNISLKRKSNDAVRKFKESHLVELEKLKRLVDNALTYTHSKYSNIIVTSNIESSNNSSSTHPTKNPLIIAPSLNTSAVKPSFWSTPSSDPQRLSPRSGNSVTIGKQPHTPTASHSNFAHPDMFKPTFKKSLTDPGIETHSTADNTEHSITNISPNLTKNTLQKSLRPKLQLTTSFHNIKTIPLPLNATAMIPRQTGTPIPLSSEIQTSTAANALSPVIAAQPQQPSPGRQEKIESKTETEELDLKSRYGKRH